MFLKTVMQAYKQSITNNEIVHVSLNHQKHSLNQNIEEAAKQNLT